MQIDIQVIAAFVSAILVISTPIGFVLRKYNHICDKIESIESWTEKQQIDIQDSQENRLALNRSLLAIARSMKSQGFNHTIDDAIKELEDTIFRQQTEGVSYMQGKKKGE